MTTNTVDVLVSEVGPRDGLQSADSTMRTDDKKRWIEALAAAGLQEIEVGSFVSPKRVPQLADTAEVVQYATRNLAVRVVALAPNLRGVRDAITAGAHAVTVPVSASETHSMNNVGRTIDQAVEEVRAANEYRVTHSPDTRLEVGISTAFGCTLEGEVSEAFVMTLAGRLAEAGSDSVGLSDTTGYANPAQVKRMFEALRREIGEKAGAAHLHNTRGQGLANVVAALDAGVTTIDSSLAGLGGCPWAPGASGNIVTEDLIFLLEAMGLRTGVNIDALLEAREVLARAMPTEDLYGHVPDAGLPKTFTYASEARS